MEKEIINPYDVRIKFRLDKDFGLVDLTFIPPHDFSDFDWHKLAIDISNVDEIISILMQMKRDYERL